MSLKRACSERCSTAKRLSVIGILSIMMVSALATPAHARILFQDDSFHDVNSEALIIDSDGSGASNTTIQFGNDGTASENGNITWDITGNEFQFDHTVDITGDLDVSGKADFINASEFHLREVADEAAATCTTVDEIVLDTTENTIYVCTATGSPGTWTAASTPADDFEDVYGADGDKTLTTSGGNFDISTGNGNVGIALGSGEFDVTSTGLIDFNVANLDVDLTGAFTIDAVSDSSLTTSTGDITFTAGDDLIFDDAQLTGIVQLSDSDTDWNATFSGNGIIDNINSFVSTVAGEGASQVGTEAGSFTNFTPATNDVQAALEAIDTKLGAEGENLLFYPEYPDTVVFQDGSNNRGRLDAEYDSTNSEHFYRWTSRQGTAQDIDLRFRFPLPDDFADVNNFTFRYRTGSAVSGDNSISVTVSNVTDTDTCGSSNDNVSAATWATGTITEATLETGCANLDAGDLIEILIKLLDNSGSADFADVGYVQLDYDNI